MLDEIFDRAYQSGRSSLNAGIDRGVSRIGHSVDKAFTALHRIQFAAPWRKRQIDVGCA